MKRNGNNVLARMSDSNNNGFSDFLHDPKQHKEFLTHTQYCADVLILTSLDFSSKLGNGCIDLLKNVHM